MSTKRFDAWLQCPRNFVTEQAPALEAWQAACDAALADLRVLRKKYRDQGYLHNARAIERAIVIVQRVKRDERKRGLPC